ncbi:MAG TPA: calcium-binding protein [Syntrophorhabdaceae bacterium]|nr:calcium-binding protein [Syntrophorhabdaceae bacterium]
MVWDASGQLQSLVEQFIAATDAATRDTLMDQILIKWTGSEDVVDGSRGAFFDAKKLAVIEKLLGQDFVGMNGPNPNDLAGPLLAQTYEGLSEMFYAQLMAQTHLKYVYDAITYALDEETQSLKGDLTASIEALVAGTGMSDAPEEFIRTIHGFQAEEMFDLVPLSTTFELNDEDAGWQIESAGRTIVEGTVLNDSLFANPLEDTAMRGDEGDDNIYGNTGKDILYGNEGRDNLVGGCDDDILRGGKGDDRLYGQNANDILDGGSGNDTLSGGQGDDIYIFARGYEHDAIEEESGVDTVSFTGLNQPDIEYAISGTSGDNGILLRIKETGETLRIKGWFASSDKKIETFQFADGTTLTGAEVEAMALASGIAGTEGNDILSGPKDLGVTLSGKGGNDWITAGNANDTIYGGAGHDNLLGQGGDDIIYGEDGGDMMNGNTGNDTLYGGAGDDNVIGEADNDLLDGGAGNDVLSGGTGDDTYLFGRGSGFDRMTDDSGSDILTLTGLNQSDVEFSISGAQYDNGLLVRIKDTGETTRLTGWFDGTGTKKIETFQFADGTTLTGAEVEAIAITTGVVGTDDADTLFGPTDFGATIQGKGGNDNITAGNANDTIYGGAGHDNLLGQGGDDIIYGEDGGDMMNGNTGNDTLYGGAGDDNVIGEADNDLLDGGAGNDVLSGGTGDDTYLFGRGSGNDVINDDGGNDTVQMGTGLTPDSLIYTVSGISGDNGLFIRIKDTGETLRLRQWLNGDQYKIESFQFEDGSVMTASQVEAAAMGTILGTEGNDTITGPLNTGVTIYGLGGNDTITAGNAGDIIYGGAGYENISGQGGDDIIYGENDGDTLNGDAGNDTVYGGGGNDNITGGAGNDMLSGDAGNDNINGGPGDDTYLFGRGGGFDRLYEDSGNDTLRLTGLNRANVEFSISGTRYDNGIQVRIKDTGEAARFMGWLDGTGTKKIETVQFEDGTTMAGSEVEAEAIAAGVVGTEGADELWGPQNFGVTIWGKGGNDVIYGSNVNDTIYGGAGGENIAGQGGDDIIYGEDGGDMMNGNTGNDTLYGGADNDQISGEAGNDLLDGGTGDDRMVGSTGNDAYYVDSAGDIVTEAVNEGTDTVFSSISYTLPANVENLTLTGTSPINGTGNGMDNVLTGNANTNILTGNAGNDTIDGREGADTMTGGLGNDTFFVDNFGDTVTEAVNEGTDTVNSSVSYSLGANIENLTLIGNDVINGTGNTLDNIITGNSAANILDGVLGADTMTGGLGDDTYIVDNSGDLVIESVSEGADTVASSINYTLSVNIENLTLAGTDSINGTGNNLDNIIKGNSAANILDGLAGYDLLDGGVGADTMIGGSGDDTYYVDDQADTIVEVVGEGTDVVYSTVSYTLSDNVENLILAGNDAVDGTGNALTNVLTGNNAANILSAADGDDLLRGAMGNDTLIGGTGSDTYIFQRGDGQDTIIEYGADTDTDAITFSAGIGQADLLVTRNADDLTIAIRDTDDTITIKDWYLQEQDNHKIELFNFPDGTTLTGTDIAGMVRGLIQGTSGDDTLYGTSENDILDGLGGNDYLSANGGNDILYGGSGNDTLIGGTDSDTMFGGAGNDTYYVDSLGDVVTENADEGTDSVRSSVSYTLADNIENMTLIGIDAINGTGNILDNQIYGNSGNNTLDGGAGSDYLSADGGNDILYGGADNDTLIGGTGIDTMFGGADNDTYYVDDPGDVVVEAVEEGTDSVRSSVTYALTDNVENLTLTGTDPINGTGNNLNNQLYGNTAANILSGEVGDDYISADGGDDILYGGSGNDTLIGGTGADSMGGGAGNDTYYVDNAGDITTENAGEGTDSVRSSVTYTLTDNIENLTLTGTDPINGTGNILDNQIYGNSGNNTLDGGVGNDYLSADGGDDILYGGAGNDTLIGGTDSDTMFGGAGNDTYYVDDTSDVITEAADEGTDSVRSSVTYTLADNIENLTLTGTDGINGTGNILDNQIYGNSGNNTLDGGEGNDYLSADGGDDILYGGAGNDTLIGGTGVDAMFGGAGNDTYYVDDTSDVITEAADEGTDSVRSSVTYTLADNIENLTLTGTDSINGTGNALDNQLYGNSGSNTLTGEAGNDYLSADGGDDILYGGSGNDTLIGGTGADSMGGGAGNDTYYVDNAGDITTENAGEGTDSVRSSVTYTLTDNIENLTLTGTDPINGTGNILDNQIYGNSGNNTLDGGVGNDYLSADGGDDILYGGAGNDTLIGGTDSDTMFGGAGNDTYYVDNLGDVVTENADEGTDSVRSSVSYALTNNIENLTLTGTDSINGTGNDLNNQIYGNTAANIISGEAGNDYLSSDVGDDTLIGGIGNDTLIGGADSDTYIFSLNGGTDTVTDTGSDASTLDKVLFNSDVMEATVALFKNGQNLYVGYGSTDQVNITNQFSADAGVERLELNNGLFLTNDDVNLVIQQMTAFAADHQISMTSLADVRANQDLMNIIANSWHT